MAHDVKHSSTTLTVNQHLFSTSSGILTLSLSTSNIKIRRKKKEAKKSHYTQTTMMHGEELEVHITHAHRFSIKVL